MEKIWVVVGDNGYGNLVVCNKWVKGQMIVYFYVNLEDKFVENIFNSYFVVVKRFYQEDEKIIEVIIFFNGENVLLVGEICFLMDV